MAQPDRKPNRLVEYDYGQAGAYFVTLCTQGRAHLFRMESSTVGNGLCAVPHRAVGKGNPIIHKWIRETERKFSNISVEKYVIMPDHLHLIIAIKEPLPGSSLPEIMRFFKTMTTNEYIRGVKSGLLSPFDGKLWQKSYYDHVIRKQQDYNEIWEYIENNPAKWMILHNKL